MLKVVHSWTTTLQKQGLYAWWNDDNNTFTICTQMFEFKCSNICHNADAHLNKNTANFEAFFFYLLSRSFHNALSFFFWRKSVSIVAQQ